MHGCAALRDLYLVYLDLRDQSQLNRCTPILVQCYDYVTPRNHPPMLLGIPLADHSWVHREFEQKGIDDPALQRALFALLPDALADMLLRLSRERRGFHLVDTRGTLEVVAVDDLSTEGDWQDEMHPSARGYRKLAGGRINPAIGELFPRVSG
ncbi:MAG: hypothetical protein AB2807_05970 [Candidatus Sedimenticola endophacoides]